MKKLFIIAAAAIAVSCGNKLTAQQSEVAEKLDSVENVNLIAVEPQIEGFAHETIVNSASEANTARFTLDKEDESFSISMEPGNKIMAVLNSSEIRNQMFQGKWEIKDGHYVASLGIGNGSDGTDIVITIPNTMETAKVKSVANGEEKEYKLNYLKYFKLEVDTSSKAYDDYAIERIKEFYKKYVFGHEEATDEVIHNYCTKKLAKKLADDYEEEAVVDNNENNGGGYAVWDFRSGAQDGDSDIQKVNSVEALGEGKYKVSYNDMGNKGSCIISVVVDGDKVLFDEIN